MGEIPSEFLYKGNGLGLHLGLSTKNEREGREQKSQASSDHVCVYKNPHSCTHRWLPTIVQREVPFLHMHV